ncbi:hypothetical protein [Orientia tsutsugamushi]
MWIRHQITKFAKSYDAIVSLFYAQNFIVNDFIDESEIEDIALT